MKILLALLFLANVALAQEIAPPAPPAAEPTKEKEVKTVFRKEESHKFSGSKLKGKLKKPEMSYIYQRKGLRAEKIVNVPENFNEEINSGADRF